jgi:hypothetical protein
MNLLENFRHLLSEAPLDFIGTGDTASGGTEEKRFYELVGEFEAEIQEASDMLEFFFGQMQMHSPDMEGQHSYRFRSGGWPMTHCKGPNAEEAVKAAINEIKKQGEKSE